MAILLVLTVPLALAGGVLFAYGAVLAFRHGLGGSRDDVAVPDPQYGLSIQNPRGIQCADTRTRPSHSWEPC